MRRAQTLLILLVLTGTVGLLRPYVSSAGTTGKTAPEISGDHWINSKPLTIAGLKGRVVLVEFWTYGCVNCRNIVPYLRHEQYDQAGLTVLGVHAPEFFWEKPLDNVKAATRRLGIKFPVVQDNAFTIWNRYGIRAWPTIVLIDKKGIIRYSHIGEGAYEQTKAMIGRLLAEAD
jgi:thiol-disulfide isomerase/thioredoxin